MTSMNGRPGAPADAAAQRVAFRQLLDGGKTFLVPGAPNALTARLIEDAGFAATYVTGAGIANTYLGLPDIGLLSLPEIASHVTAINGAVRTPLIVDADTGFGNAINMWHTIRILERAGASAIQVEDQTFPKRCGHFEGKSTVDTAEMVDKIQAGVEARSDHNLLIIARTDTRAEYGLDEACRRANAYREAGADITFVEAPQSVREIEIVAETVPGPKVLNIVQGGKTPEVPLERLQELGYSFVLYANLPLVVGMHAVRELLRVLASEGGMAGSPPFASWAERQALVRKDFFDALGDKFSSDGTAPGSAVDLLLSRTDEPGVAL